MKLQIHTIKLLAALISISILSAASLFADAAAINQKPDSAADLVVAPPVPRKSAVLVTKASEERLTWWREARFGMFIHWGLFSITGKGGWDLWSQKMSIGDYASLTNQFSAEKFSAQDWVKIAKDAGMKYMVMVTKHHDGFALFDSKDYPFNAMKSAAHRDFVKGFADAAHQAGMRIGFYYSPLDWQYPGYFFPDLYRENAEAMREKYHRQVLELMSNYGKVDILWYDGGGPNWLAFGGLEYGGNASGWHPRDRSKGYAGKFNWQDDVVNTRARELQPNLILNDRTGTLADFETREGEKRLVDYNDQTPWELCTTLAGGWGYMPGRTTPMSLEKCVRLLVNTVGRDGNLLLNVGPRPDGEIEPEQVARLKELGQWLEKYGESIYGTRGGPFLPGDYGVSTRRGKKIYIHVLEWAGESLRLPPLPAKVVSASILGGKPIDQWSQDDQGIKLFVTATRRTGVDTVIALELDQPAQGIKPVEVAPQRTAAEGVRLEKDIDYLVGDNQPKADLYAPVDIPKGQLCPGIVIIHGGGWVGGDKASSREQNIGNTLARQGYICLSINYVLATGNGVPTWPENLQQCKTAVRWLRKNASRLQIDPEDIGVIGGSAGGHLASMLGVTGSADGLDPAGPYAEYSCQVQAVVDMYGIADLMTWRDSMSMGGTRKEVPDVYRKASPINYLKKGQPPFLILHGTADTTVPVEQSKQFAAAMKTAGVNCQLVILEGAAHTFDLQPKQRDLRPVVIGFFDQFLKRRKK